MDDTRQLPAMWKLFVSIMVSGLAAGLVATVVGHTLADRSGLAGLGVYLAVNLLAGLAYSFLLYVFVKIVLRSFVRKLHTLERVVVGTQPPLLPGVLRSNEIDEVERSTARIVAELDSVRAQGES